MSITMEEALGLTPKKSQNITFNASEKADIEAIKVLLTQHKTQAEIAAKLNCVRETVSRKIAKWMLTDDFSEWLNTVWLEQYNTLSDDSGTKVEAFKQLTRLLCAKATRKIEAKSEHLEKVTVDVNETRALLQRYEVIIRAAGVKDSPVQQDSGKEQVDTVEATHN